MSNNKKAAVKWASDDDAGDLLAGILDETQTEAELEQQRIEAEIRQREEEARRQKEEEERLRRAEAEARISAEMDRLQEVEKRRTQKLEALKIEELKESGQWEPPQQAAAPAAQAQAQAPVQHAPVPEAAPVPQAAPPAAEKKSNAMPLAILGGVLGLVVVAGGVVFALMSGGYKVDNTAYSKSVYTPKDPQASLVDKAFAPIPKEEPVAEVEEAAPARSSSRSSRPASRSSTASSSSSSSGSRPARSTVNKSDGKKSKKIDGLDLNFDPFGSGF